jgi:hypothetical protein
LFDREVQLWTKLEEDQQVQQWDQEEEKISATIQDLKQRQKTMKIIEHLKGVQDMKKLQEELIAAQTQKKDQQAQMEPLQELVAGGHCVGRRGKEEHGTNSGRVHRDDQRGDYNMQVLDALREKTAGSNTSKGTHREVPDSHRSC